MAYEKTNWVDGETEIDAQKLNKMEEGIVEASQTGGILTGSIVAYDGDTIPEGYEEVDKQQLELIHGTTTATTDDLGRISVPIPVNAKCDSARCTSDNYFAFLRSINTEGSKFTLCYIRHPDTMAAIKNTEVTIAWSYLNEV